MPEPTKVPAAAIPHDGLVVTPFKEFRGVYERRKAEALAKHLRTVADIADRAAVVRACPKAPERPVVGLQEWTNNFGQREGQWQTDLEIEALS